MKDNKEIKQDEAIDMIKLLLDLQNLSSEKYETPIQKIQNIFSQSDRYEDISSNIKILISSLKDVGQCYQFIVDVIQVVSESNKEQFLDNIFDDFLAIKFPEINTQSVDSEKLTSFIKFIELLNSWSYNNKDKPRIVNKLISKLELNIEQLCKLITNKTVFLYPFEDCDEIIEDFIQKNFQHISSYNIDSLEMQNYYNHISTIYSKGHTELLRLFIQKSDLSNAQLLDLLRMISSVKIAPQTIRNEELQCLSLSTKQAVEIILAKFPEHSINRSELLQILNDFRNIEDFTIIPSINSLIGAKSSSELVEPVLNYSDSSRDNDMLAQAAAIKLNSLKLAKLLTQFQEKQRQEAKEKNYQKAAEMGQLDRFLKFEAEYEKQQKAEQKKMEQKHKAKPGTSSKKTSYAKLIEAIECHDLANFKLLVDKELRKGQVVDSKKILDANQNNIMHLVMNLRFTDALHFLLQETKIKVSSLFDMNQSKKTPLHIFLDKGSLSHKDINLFFKLLVYIQPYLESKDITTTSFCNADSNEHTIFHLVQNHPVAKELLEKCIAPKLSKAIIDNNYHVISKLLEAGFDVNTLSFQDGNTMLHQAISEQNLKMIKFLLNNGAKTYIKNDKQQDALTLSRTLGNEEIKSLIHNAHFKKLLEDEPVVLVTTSERDGKDEMTSEVEEIEETKLQKANTASSKKQNVDALVSSSHYALLVKSFVEGLVDIDHQDTNGNTSLHHAVIKGSETWIKTLMLHGASPHIKNKDGKSPVDLASKKVKDILLKNMPQTGGAAGNSDEESYKMVSQSKPQGKKEKKLIVAQSEISMQVKAVELLTKLQNQEEIKKAYREQNSRDLLKEYAKEFNSLLKSDQSSHISLDIIIKIFQQFLSNKDNKAKLYIDAFCKKIEEQGICDQLKNTNVNVTDSLIISIFTYMEHTKDENVQNLKTLLQSFVTISQYFVLQKSLTPNNIKIHLGYLSRIINKAVKIDTTTKLIEKYGDLIIEMSNSIDMSELMELVSIFDQFGYQEIDITDIVGKLMKKISNKSAANVAGITNEQIGIYLKYASSAFEAGLGAPSKEICDISFNNFQKELEHLLQIQQGRVQAKTKIINEKAGAEYISKFLLSFVKLQQIYTDYGFVMTKNVFHKIYSLITNGSKLFSSQALVNTLYGISVLYQTNKEKLDQQDTFDEIKFNNFKDIIRPILKSNILSMSDQHKLLVADRILCNVKCDGLIDLEEREKLLQSFKKTTAQSVTISKFQQNVTNKIKQIIKKDYIIETEKWLSDAISSVDIMISIPKELDPLNEKYSSCLIIQVDGPHHFSSDSSGLSHNVSTLLNSRLLQDAGYKLVRISYQDWIEAANNHYKYLVSIINKAAPNLADDRYIRNISEADNDSFDSDNDAKLMDDHVKIDDQSAIDQQDDQDIWMQHLGEFAVFDPNI